MKQLKWVGIGVICLPFILIAGLLLFEIFGMAVNHAAAGRQTKELQAYLESKISDIEIIQVHSETGNMSGTGNHVECVSVVTFSTEMSESEIKRILSEDGYYGLYRTEDGSYSCYLETSAPFPDNIEGH